MGYDRDEYRTKQPQDFISMLYPELRKEFKDCAVLDVGCGRGAVSLSIAPYAKSVLGIDIDEGNIGLCRERAEATGLTNVRFIKLSAFDLRPVERYDVVILSDVLEHVQEQRTLLERCIDMMAPEGYI